MAVYTYWLSLFKQKNARKKMNFKREVLYFGLGWAYYTKGVMVKLMALPLAVMVKLGLNKAGMGKSGSGYGDWKKEGNVGGFPYPFKLTHQ